jgi:hypothetical protein
LHSIVTGAGVAYNKFHLGKIIDNKINVHILTAGDGWVNENIFYGGRFSWASGKAGYTDTIHVKIEDAGNAPPNNNRFMEPSFEGSGEQIFNCDSINNEVHNCRIEKASSYEATDIEFGANSSRNIFTTSFTDSLLSDGPTISGTIVTTSANVFTITGDKTGRLHEGALIACTLDDATINNAIIYESTYSSVTTVRLTTALPDYVVTTNEIDSIQTLPIYDDGRTNVVKFAKADYDSVSNMKYQRFHETLSYFDGGVSLKGTGTKIPALSLVPSSSAGDYSLVSSDFSGYTFTVTGNGDINVFDSATGNKLMTFIVSSQRFALYDASDNETVRIDGPDASVSILASSDGSGVANNSIFKKTSDGKLYFKDNGGTDRALY